MGKQNNKTVIGSSAKEKTKNTPRKLGKSPKKLGEKIGEKSKLVQYVLDPEKIKKYKRGGNISVKKVKDKKLKGKLKISEKNYDQAVKQASRSELLMTEESGFLEVEGVERTHKIRQEDIVNELDLHSAQKHFNLKLDQFSPYKINYTRNGKYLLIGGNKGHLATIDWQNKNLGSEIQVKETVRDVCWLHQDQFYAAAQKKYVHIYDTQGIEIHAMKDYTKINRMQFLPYHFLLASIGDPGVLHYLDTSIGKHITSLRTKLGRCDCMATNPFNAVVQLGHAAGSVTMWSPVMKEPLVKMFCHRGPVLSIATEKKGIYMATSGLDGKMKMWDIRMYKPVYEYYIRGKAAHCLAISQRGLLAVGYGSKIDVFKDALSHKQGMPYMCHRMDGADISSIEFCPYEDVLGIGHTKGFSSILIPGAGEPNFDALEANPFETKSQRREHEVKMLLEKIQPEMITLNPNDIHRIDSADNVPKNKGHEKGTEKEEIELKHKTKGRSSSSKVVQRKQGVKELSKREERQAAMLEEKRKARKEKLAEAPKTKVEQLDPTAHALDRFKSKPQR